MDQGGVSIYTIDDLFPLKPPLVIIVSAWLSTHDQTQMSQ